VAPALYWRRGAPKDPEVMEQVFPVMFGLPDNEAVQDLNAAADYLNAMPGATGKVGAIGFCSGGRHTLLFACSSSKVNAAIDCWGGFIDRATPDAQTTAARPKPPLDMVGQLHCPLFGVFGVEDQNPPVALEAELKKRAQAVGKDVTTKIYQGAGHAFLADYRPSYREGPAHELWGDIQSFFGRHLK
jgi:carboxymethylenebutenolidase